MDSVRYTVDASTVSEFLICLKIAVLLFVKLSDHLD